MSRIKWRDGANVIAEYLPRGGAVNLVLFITIFGVYVFEDPLVHERMSLMFSPYANTIITGAKLGVISVVVYFVVVRISILFSHQKNNYVDHAYSRIGTAEKKPMSDQRKKRVAYHEAGHLLALAYFGEKPQSLAVNISSHVGPTLGCVTYEFDDDFMCSRKSQMAIMRGDLAGAIAEELVYGDCCVGAQTDNASWEYRAKNMMEAFMTDHQWFHVVSNEYEAYVNSNTLKYLKEQMSECVKKFIQKNEALLHEAAEYIYQSGQSREKDLYDFVSRARVHW